MQCQLVVQLAAAVTPDCVEVFVTFQAATLYSFTWGHGLRTTASAHSVGEGARCGHVGGRVSGRDCHAKRREAAAHAWNRAKSTATVEAVAVVRTGSVVVPVSTATHGSGLVQTTIAHAVVAPRARSAWEARHSAREPGHGSRV